MVDKSVSLLPAAAGVNTRADEANLPEQTIREAVNVTIDNAGKVKRRDGYTKVLDLTDAHSLYTVGDLMLCVHDGALVRVDTDALTTTVVHANAGLSPVSYAQVNDWVFYTSERIQGRVNAYAPEVFYPTWGVDYPGGNPTVSAGAGSLAVGDYQITVTFIDSQGQESGAAAPVQFSLTAAGGLVLSNIPQGDASGIRIYCTLTNGTELYRQAQVAMGTTSYTITQLTRGRPLQTLFLEPLPTGEIVRYHSGRLWVASGNVVYYSQPLYYGLHSPDEDYLPPFPSAVTVMEAVDDGLFIVADRTYFLRGTSPTEFTLRTVDPAKAVRGSSLQVRAQLISSEQTGDAAYWFDEDGPVLGFTGGQVIHSTIESLPGVVSLQGASGIMRDGGVDRVVTSLTSPTERSGFAAFDSSTIEVISSSSL